MPDQPAVEARHQAPPWNQRAAVFLGANIEEGSDPEAGFTIGLDYEWRFHQWYGIGGLGQVVTSGSRDAVLGPALFLHPVGSFRMTLAPAAERAQGDWYFAFRLGFEYDVTLRAQWVLSPSVALDFARGNRIYVLGVSAGRIF